MFTFSHNNLYCAHKYDERPRNTDDREYMSHCHNGIYELYFFIRGQVTYTVENEKRKLEPGDAIIIKPGEFHSVRFDGDAPYERVIMQIPGYALPYSATDMNMCRYYRYDSVFGTIDDLMNFSYESYRDKPMLLYHNFVSLGTILFSYLVAHCGLPQNTRVTGNRIVNEIIKYVDDNIMNPISVEEIYEMLPYSRTSVYSQFKKFTNVSLKKYINLKRISYAQNLISTGNSPTEVARIMNFDNYYTFYRLYVSVVGRGPHEDRKAILSTETDDVSPNP